jgi:hypothetical protein
VLGNFDKKSKISCKPLGWAENQSVSELIDRVGILNSYPTKIGFFPQEMSP